MVETVVETRSVPSYDELPALGDLGVRHAWGVWGEHDRLGTLNRLTDDVCLRALQVPTSGHRVNLTLPLGTPDPPLYDRHQLVHEVFQRNRNMIEDELHQLDPQGSSQWDSLRHIAARQFGFYGGASEWDSPGARQLGVHNLVGHGLVMRGVLLDLPAYWTATGQVVDPFTDHSVEVAELLQAAEHQNVNFAKGDLLLVRTGWLHRYRTAGGVPEGNLAMPPSAGLAADEGIARFLWDTGFCAVATDNPAVEVLPGDPAVGSLHRRLIPALGMPLGELWDLDDLAAECAAADRYEMLVVSVPLHVTGGVASPANALAVL